MKMLDVPQSGSIAGITSSRNRYGQYRRTRAVPVNPNSSNQGAVRARLALVAAAWRTLTAAQMAGWEALAASMSRTDSLGQVIQLTGAQAYASVNCNNLAAGNATVDDAPILETPEAIETATITLTSAAFSVAYTPTPLGTGERLFIFCSPQRSAGRSFEGDFRLIAVTAAAAASPHNLLAAYTARLGVPVTGNKVFLQLQRYKGGFLSGPLLTSALVA